MITVENLRERVDYFKENGESLGLGSESKPLFLDGKFNSDNWNGGDALIRQFCSMLESEHFGEFVTYGNDTEMLVCKLYRYEDQTYVSIVHIENSFFSGEEKSLFSGMETFTTQYDMEWYKNRGRVDYARYNSETMTEEEYLKLLNKIEELAQFKFELNVDKK